MLKKTKETIPLAQNKNTFYTMTTNWISSLQELPRLSHREVPTTPTKAKIWDGLYLNNLQTMRYKKYEYETYNEQINITAHFRVLAF